MLSFILLSSCKVIYFSLYTSDSILLIIVNNNNNNNNNIVNKAPLPFKGAVQIMYK